MLLPESEYKEFLELHMPLLYFVGQQTAIVSAAMDFQSFTQLDLKVKFKCREALLENDQLLDDYLSRNADRLTAEQAELLKGFKRCIKGNFIILKCLKNHAVFLGAEDNQFYAVKALGTRFHEFFGNFPVLVSANILPFKDKIIYDGFLQSNSIYFEKEMTATMNENYKEAKKMKQINTTL
ncbi:succinate dehydrogenase assembly factor 2 [Pontibacter beigongshangensis]|uniref:succinate dehydrogenase assembly factor 2 n=1 Tax=Pontibacter beigongshangensis TaxID=2574733 RepID=UPI001650446A|nr:succinate dehydrogenase assembly factor 2 [Pontibacter beigongshangensis]